MKWKKEQTTVLEDKYASLKALVESFPDDVNNWEQLADCCIDILKLDEAEAIYNNLILQFPDKCKYYYRLGKVYFSNNLFEQALVQQEKAIEIWRDFLWAKFEKAKALFELKRKYESREILRDIVNTKPF